MKKMTQIAALAVCMLFGMQIAKAQLAGDYYVGSGPVPPGGNTYASLNAAITAINSNGLSGDATLWINSDIEITTMPTLNEFSGGTLYIRPYQEARRIHGSISGNLTSALIKFFETDNVHIDGSLNGTSRDLTFENTGNGEASTLWFASDGSDGCENIVIQNCIIYGPNDVDDIDVSAIAFMEVDEIDDYGRAHGPLTVHNNHIMRAHYGVYLFGGSSSSSNRHKDITITDNIFGPPGGDYSDPDRIDDKSVYTRYIDGMLFKGNHIHYTEYAADFNNHYGDLIIEDNVVHASKWYGIYVDNSFVKSTDELIIRGNEIKGVRSYGFYLEDLKGGIVEDNYIHDFLNPNIDGSQTTGIMAGIYFYDDCEDVIVRNNRIEGIVSNYDGSSSFDGEAYGIYAYCAGGYDIKRMKIYNNYIADIRSRGTDDDFEENPWGIYLSGGEDYEIMNNTINMTGTFTGNNSGVYSGCILIGDYDTDVKTIENNIFINSLMGTNSTAYGIYIEPDGNNDITLGSIDNNVYDLTGAAATGRIGFNDGEEYTFLSDWQTGMNKDANSAATEVFLLDDGHLAGESVGDPDLEVPRLSDVTVDIDGETRPAGEPTTAGMDIAVIEPLTVTQPIIKIPDQEIYCPGDEIEFTFGASAGFADGIERDLGESLSFSWYYEDTEGNTEVINEFTDEAYILNGGTLIIDGVDLEHEGYYYSIATFSDQSVTSDMKEVSVSRTLELIDNLVTYHEGCVGQGEITLSVEAENATAYVWEKRNDMGYWEVIEDAPNADTYVIDLMGTEGEMPTAEELNGQYRVKIEGNEYCPPHELYSDVAEIELYNPIHNIEMDMAGEDIELCYGDDISLTASADGDFTGYQWQKFQAGSWININPENNPTAVEPTLVLNSVTEGSSAGYRVEFLRPNDLCHEDPVYSGAVNISVPPIFELTEHPSSHIICEDGSVELFVLDNGNGEIHDYTWYKDGDEIEFPEGTPVEEKKLLIIESAGIDDIGNYYAVITAEDCRGVQEFTTETAAVYILQETEITKQPYDRTGLIGENVTFSVEAHMKGIVPPYYQHDFQWFRRDAANPSNVEEIITGGKYLGAKTERLTINNIETADYGWEYYVVVTGRCGTPVTSDAVSILQVPGVNITAQPESTEICEASTVIFKVDAEPTVAGVSLDYQWYSEGDMLSDGGDVSGAATSELSINNIDADDAGEYYVVVEAENGLSAESDRATLTVNSMPEVTVQPEDVTVKKDDELVLTVEADGVEPMEYQWFKDGNELLGETEAEFRKQFAADADAGDYYVAITNSCGTVESDIITVTVEAQTPNSVVERNIDGIKLYANTPNPFSESTQIRFGLERPADVIITLTDGFGRELGTMINNGLSAGVHTIELSASDYNLSSGTYFYTIITGDKTLTGKMTIVK